jgi:DNA-binding transcriptional MocR family regulator
VAVSGGEVRGIELRQDSDFFEDLQRVYRQTMPRPKILVINFPHNPTTAVVDISFFKKVVAFAKEHNVIVIHDLAYADLVFDVRCLPNPHYDPALRPLTGRDQPVANWLKSFADVELMVSDIESFIRKWLPRYTEDTRSYLTVAIGCTGGKHRSVYVVETLAKRFAEQQLLVRHRHQPEISG